MTALRKAAQRVDATIVRLKDNHEVEGDPICRTTGYLNPAGLLALFEATDLTANPRLPRVNDQVKEMKKGLADAPTAFEYKNNGILIAASACEALERGRYRLRFDPVDRADQPRGILNGGHTTFACMGALVQTAAEIKQLKEPRYREWEEFRNDVWPQWRQQVLDTIEEMPSFFVPVEILYPKDGRTSQYDSLIHEIADARNNNCQLTEETKANHAGYYVELKAAMPDDEIRNAIEWRTNDGGRIKVKDVVALACVPLSTVSEEVANLRIDLKHIYNSTAKCSAYFNSIYEHEDVSQPKGAQRILSNDGRGRLVASAINLTRELIEVYDWLTIEFPKAYNASGGSFGAIESVKGEASKNDEDDDRQYKTRFWQKPCGYSFSDGFFMPILASVRMLIERDGSNLRWSENPVSFLSKHLDRAMKIFRGKIKDLKYDGREVGRDSGSYETAYETLSLLRDTRQ